jgi:hypothetical protein
VGIPLLGLGQLKGYRPFGLGQLKGYRPFGLGQLEGFRPISDSGPKRVGGFSYMIDKY